MILTERFVELVQNFTSAIWASNCNFQQVPDVVRLQGVQVSADKEHITFYLPLRFGDNLINNFSSNDQLTFLMGVIETNESYQLKGQYISHWPCIADEIKYQQKYINGFCDTVERQGLSKEKAFKAYFHQPSMAVKMYVKEIYEQTPKIGTGKKISSI